MSTHTVNTRAGSVTVAVPGTVAVNKTVSGSMSDVTVGSSVTVASTSDASGNYKIVARLFNMEARDYNRFLNFLRKHDCQIPFKEYR